jgi:transposase
MEKIDARKLPRDAQDEMRRQAMRMREELKLPWKEIARVVGVNVSTVIGWSKRYLREGTAGLKSKTRGRRYLSGRTLTLVQEWQLRSVIVGENPKQMSLPYALWNRRAVMQLVKVLFDIDMPIRTVGEYLLRWGYTPQRPIKRALEQNPVKVEQWMHETYPTIAARAKAEGAVIYWADETAVAEDGHWLRGYAPAGQTPVLAAPSKRYGLSMISAISNQGLVRFEFIEEAMNTELFIEFMEKLVADSPQKVFLILSIPPKFVNELCVWCRNTVASIPRSGRRSSRLRRRLAVFRRPCMNGSRSTRSRPACVLASPAKSTTASRPWSVRSRSCAGPMRS